MKICNADTFLLFDLCKILAVKLATVLISIIKLTITVLRFCFLLDIYKTSLKNF